MIQYRGDSYPDWTEKEGQYVAREQAEKEIEQELLADEVNHPSHYKSGTLETIEVIEAFDFGFNLGNAFKYISRAGKKDAKKHVQDLEKSIWYIKREIKALEKELEKEYLEDGNRRQHDWSL